MFKVWGLHKNLCMVPGSSSPTSSWRWGRTWWCWWSWWWCWPWLGHDDHGNATMTTIFSGKGELPQQVQETPTIFLKMLGLMLLPGQSTMDNDEKTENIGNMNEIHKSAMTCLSFIVMHNLLLESNYVLISSSPHALPPSRPTVLSQQRCWQHLKVKSWP